MKKITEKGISVTISPDDYVFVTQPVVQENGRTIDSLRRVKLANILSLVSGSDSTTGGPDGNASQSGLADVQTILRNLMTIIRSQVEDSAGTPQAYSVDVSGLAAECDTLIAGLTSPGGEDSGGGTTDKTLTNISATYSGGDVSVGTAVSALTGIVVTAHYSDGSAENVTGYTLSGEIAEGENTVIVSYGGKTTTITVTGVADTQAPVTLEPVVTGNCTIQTSAITEGAVPDTVVLISSGSVCRVFALESGKTYEISGDAAYDSVYPYPPFVIADISWDKKLPTSGSSNISNKSLYCPVVPSDYSNWEKMTAEYTATVDCYAIVSGSYDVIQK